MLGDPRFTRRILLKASLASALFAGLPRRARAEEPKKKPIPRYFVTVFLRGGMDAVYTTDPKTRAQVEKNIDVPYDTNSIIDAGGSLQFGPHFKPLAKWGNEIAVVRGLQVSTANHETGAYQMLRMRTGVMPNMPSFNDIVGQHRDSQPLASVTIGKLSSFEASPGSVIASTADAADAVTSLDEVDKLSDEEAAILATAFKGHLKRLPSHGSAQLEATRDHVMQAQAFFAKLQGVPRFKPDDWDTNNADARRAAEDLQRTLWFLKNDLARGVLCKIQFDWDSHYRNVDKQSHANGDFTAMFARFIDGLHTMKNEHGTLAEQTVVVCGSELGRFPVINGNLGKDHFPETQLLVMGPGINTGHAFVPTGTRMEGQKVSFKTGMADAAGDNLMLDDLGTTLLGVAGLNPELYGYRGRRLEFLERSA